ncbi:hypothetical protein KBTX_00719 [wastewater metagenome]|uniref:HTH merR-type domain-containing protein n=3 Tax=root TaxID=1 RepID=A0A5B8R7C5_9ZZZZ|nr:hypothetical protein KBTEX_00719 [uncultured organism]
MAGARQYVKVGELARRTGLTVRTLHHYDAIGLLRPSARSGAGYRLYAPADVARLHGILALRQLGLSLADIRATLAADGVSLAGIVAEQIRSLDRRIEEARALRDRLAVLDAAMAAGEPPEGEDWLATLALLRRYREHFTAAELRTILTNWATTRGDWAALVADVHDARRRGLAPDAPEMQGLAQRWMALSMQWMEGDVALARRWGGLVETVPEACGRHGLDPVAIAAVRPALQLRLAALRRHLDEADLRAMDKRLASEWRALAERARAMIEAGTPRHASAARALLADFDALADRTAGHDPDRRRRLEQAYRSEPVLARGHFIGADVRTFLAGVREAADGA